MVICLFDLAGLGDDGLLQDASTSDVDGQEGNDHMTTMRTSEPEAPIADATRMALVNLKQPFTHYYLFIFLLSIIFLVV